MIINDYKIKPKANLRWADLQEANLQEANLRWADLQEANLRGANLRWADLRGANLRGADLQGANLQEANLRWANLQEANLYRADLPHYTLLPEGTLIVYKALQFPYIAKLQLNNDIKRICSLVGRKCRAEKALVLEIFNYKTNKQVPSAGGWRNEIFMYHSGQEVIPDKFCADIRIECSNGIHFFVTLQEAIDWYN